MKRLEKLYFNFVGEIVGNDYSEETIDNLIDFIVDQSTVDKDHVFRHLDFDYKIEDLYFMIEDNKYEITVYLHDFLYTQEIDQLKEAILSQIKSINSQLKADNRYSNIYLSENFQFDI